MSKALVETVTNFFKAQPPLWACELTTRHIIVAGVNPRRNRVMGWTAADTRTGDSIDAARPTVERLLSEAGFKGSEVAIVVPDETARIAFVTAESLSSKTEELQTFIRWKLKKSVPFDVDTAQVAYRILGRHRSGTGVDLLVALSPRSVIEQYERLFEPLDIHAGMVLPSTLALLNLFVPPAGDALVVKVAPECVTTTVFQNRRVQFYRRVTDMSLNEAVYPTVLYYQDKLGGMALQGLYVCGYDGDLTGEVAELRDKVGLPVQSFEPKSVPDMFKPVLGAVHLKTVPELMNV